ncbi:MAG: DCC1-like thiol-disulfide oxidoreductase family protein [Gammaproteobacteria bacterium]|nr:DCC1-like thiol-disulfide oxidoreductase family protein [Gammaproteobacteria bacterium]
MSKNKITLVYDKECPVCNNYCQMIRIRESVGELILVNAREESDLVKEITARGINLDQGMVLIIGDNFYNDSDTIHVLALMSNPTEVFNKINYWIFKSKNRARYLYPILRFLRGCLLRLLGKRQLNNLDNNSIGKI